MAEQKTRPRRAHDCQIACWTASCAPLHRWRRGHRRSLSRSATTLQAATSSGIAIGHEKRPRLSQRLSAKGEAD